MRGGRKGRSSQLGRDPSEAYGCNEGERGCDLVPETDSIHLRIHNHVRVTDQDTTRVKSTYYLNDLFDECVTFQVKVV